MKDFLIVTGTVGVIVGIVLGILARLGVCKDCPYASEHHNNKNKS